MLWPYVLGVITGGVVFGAMLFCLGRAVERETWLLDIQHDIEAHQARTAAKLSGRVQP